MDVAWCCLFDRFQQTRKSNIPILIFQMILPMSILKYARVRKFLLWMLPGDKRFTDALFGVLIPYILKIVQEHKETIVPSDPRNFIGKHSNKNW